MPTAVPPRAARRGLLRNLQVSQKLFASFGVLCLLVIGIGVTGLVDLARSGQRLDRMYQENLHAIALIGDIRADVQQATAYSAKLILRSPITDVGSIQVEITRLDKEIDGLWSEYT